MSDHDELRDQVKTVLIEYIGCDSEPDMEGIYWLNVKSSDYEPFRIGEMAEEIIALVRADERKQIVDLIASEVELMGGDLYLLNLSQLTEGGAK